VLVYLDGQFGLLMPSCSRPGAGREVTPSRASCPSMSPPVQEAFSKPAPYSAVSAPGLDLSTHDRSPAFRAYRLEIREAPGGTSAGVPATPRSSTRVHRRPCRMVSISARVGESPRAPTARKVRGDFEDSSDLTAAWMPLGRNGPQPPIPRSHRSIDRIRLLPSRASTRAHGTRTTRPEGRGPGDQDHPVLAIELRAILGGGGGEPVALVAADLRSRRADGEACCAASTSARAADRVPVRATDAAPAAGIPMDT